MPDDERPHPPRFVPLRLPELTDATAEDVVDRDDRQAERFRDVDLSGRDLRFVTFAECELLGCQLSDADLTGAHLIETRASDLDAAVFTAPRSEFRSVEIVRSRLGSFEVYESQWRSVLVADTKLGYLNARAGTWSDVVFRDCVITELDLSSTTATRMSFPGCRIENLQLRDSHLAEVDLRAAELHVIDGLGGLSGCTVTPDQLQLLAPLLAEHLGIDVQ